MSRLRAAVCVTALAAGAITVFTTQARAAGTTHTIPLTRFAHLVVDASPGYVFLAGGGSDGVVVRDLAGAAVTVIHSEPGATGLALSPDGTKLYVALRTADAISVIDTDSLTETDRIATGAGTCPTTVAALGSTVWFGYGCADSSAAIGALDISGEPTVHLAAATGFYYPPILAVSAALPGRIFAAAGRLSPSTVRALDVSGTTLTAGPSVDVGSNLQDMAVTADGADLITASGSPYYHPVYNTSDLSGDGQYGSNNPYPIAVATSTDGLVAAGLHPISAPDISVYTGDGTVQHSYEFGSGSSDQLAPAGLAFGGAGSRLYAVTTDDVGGTVALHVYAGAKARPTRLDLTAPSKHARATQLTIHGTLHGAADTTITVTKRDLDGTHTLRPVQASSAGAFTITDTPRVGGKNTYVVKYTGDAEHSAASKSVSVDVSRENPTISIKTDKHTYRYGARVRVTAHLGHTYRSRMVSIYVKPHGQRAILARQGKVDRRGNLTVAGRVDRNTTFTAAFAGDERYAPSRTATLRKVQASVATALRHSYGKRGRYRLFHPLHKAYVGAGVAPGKAGEQVRFPLQELSGGGWHTVVDDTFTLNHDSVVAIYFKGRTGYRYRIRAVYEGDRANLAAHSAWQYAEFA